VTPSDLLELLYAAAGGLAVLVALVSRSIRRWPVSGPLLALVVGVLLGPAATGLVELSVPVRDTVLLEGSRFLLALSVMTAALRFPVSDLRTLVKPVLLLLGVVMPVMAVVAGTASLLLGLPLALAVAVGACLAPTDPVLAASVVSGTLAEKSLPERDRQLLTAESGANDGLALPLVGLALVPLLPEDLATAVPQLAWQVLGAGALGTAVGLLAASAVTWARRRHLPSHGAELVFTLLLAVAVLGTSRLLGLGGILTVFVAGLAYNHRIGEDERGLQLEVDEAVNRFAVLPVFVVLGVVLPWADWGRFGPAALGFCALVLVARRLPVVAALSRPLGLPGRDAAFVGWFGPMGVSAIFYLAHAAHRGADDPRLFAAGTLAVTASIVVFGLTASPGRALYQRTS